MRFNRLATWTSGIAMLVVIAWLSIVHLTREQGSRPERKRPEHLSGGPPSEAEDRLSTPVAEPSESSNPKKPPNISVRDWKHLLYVQEKLTRLNGPVEFYARVIDQNGQGVQGVKLSLKLSAYNPNALSNLANYEREAVREERIELLSDGDGGFVLAGKSGTFLRVEELTKEGYTWSVLADSGLQVFDYQTDRKNRLPSYANRTEGVVFHLWKKGATEPLVRVDHRVRVDPFGTNWYAINLFRGSVDSVADADFRFRSATVTDLDGQPMRWFRFEAYHGGFVANTNPYSHLAPVRGYAPEWEWTYEPRGRDRAKSAGEALKREFYLLARDGRIYAAITWHWASETSVRVTGYVNPRGSRNLEPDPAKQIADPDEIRRLDVP